MLTLIVADAELETVPEKMWSDPPLRKYAKKKGKPVREVLLDSNYMHTSIEKYFPGQSSRRGRPDIIHILLLVALESILNRNGELRIFIHTRNDLCITVNSEVRLPKAYNRFSGLIESLMKNGEIVGDGKTLLKVAPQTIEETVREHGKGELVVLSPTGEEEKMGDIIRSKEDYTVVIGGFSEGDFISDVYSLARAYSIFKEELTIWSVASELICQYERILDMV